MRVVCGGCALLDSTLRWNRGGMTERPEISPAVADENAEPLQSYVGAEPDTIHWLPHLEVPNLGFEFLAAYDLDGRAGVEPCPR